jgi:hypothetical protein
LEVAQLQLAPLAFAMSAILAASFAREVAEGGANFEAIFPAIVLVVAIEVALFLAPVFLFAVRLSDARARGLERYGVFGAQYVREFRDKWLSGPAAGREPMLGTSDIQTLADLFNSASIVHRMRLAPFSYRSLVWFALAALAPMLPLLFLEYTPTTLATQIFQSALGLR